ncbi:universal stress protein [Halobacteriales archaeon QS_1_68_17]|nr:MAG: universal stress protein [Halobacteriales archaeon QS_1_68_17]
MYDTILIPTDGSKEAARAAEHGVELAAAFDATVHALYVIKLPGAPRTVYVRDDGEEMRAEYEAHGQEVTGDLCEQAAAAGVDCVAATRTGSIHEEIVDYADEEGIDLIVMCSTYRGTIGGLLGSISERVVRTATVPVTTLRMEGEEAAPEGE